MDVLQEEESPALNFERRNNAAVPHNTLSQPTYRSYKKKFRKLKIKFDEALQQNKDLYSDEQRAIQTARRLTIENDRILDMLYDVNCSAQIPAEKRIDLTSGAPSLSLIPPLVSDDELSQISGLESLPGKILVREINGMIAARDQSKSSLVESKSLALSMQTIPHLSSLSPHLPPDILASLEPEEGQAHPYTYLTLDQIDCYNYEIDASRGDTSTAPRPPPQDVYQDPVFGNFHSPYNWLRRHVPQIFLQDGECSEKANGKPGALRGAGKRANIPAPSKPEALEIVEEDGQGYDFAFGGGKDKEKKRKRDNDENGSTLNKGPADDNKAKRPRQVRKKKSDGSEDKPPSARRIKKAKIPSPPPGAHPFGPA